MITLLIIIIIIIWGIYSYISLYNICKKDKKSFNPFLGNVFQFMGVIISTALTVALILHSIIKYLP